MGLNKFVDNFKVINITWILLMFCSVVLSKVSKYGYDEDEGKDKKSKMQGRTMSQDLQKGQGKYGWEGNCMECSLMDIDFYNLTQEDVPRGCMDERIIHKQTSNNSEYCTWRLIHTEGKHGKVGLIGVKADELNHMDPKPESCVKHKYHYTCACLGEYCNKGLPHCKWIRKIDPENKNPVGCMFNKKDNDDWIGNCVECSLMDVDHYNLTVEELKDGCLDTRVQHFEKTNNSPYCTWRIIHTDGKAGKNGLIQLLGDHLNHMDPKPAECVKHSYHYTCACIGEYCNQYLPPCNWINKADPKNARPKGCSDGKEVLNLMGQANKERRRSCVACDMFEPKSYKKLASTNKGCREPAIRESESIIVAQYCMWTHVAKEFTYVKTHKVHQYSVIELGTALLPEDNPAPHTCKVVEGKYYCSCRGHLCNQGLPLCTWMRKAYPENKRPKNCFEDSPKRSGSTKCVKCFYHYNGFSRYKNMERACEDPRVQDYMTIQDANYCMTVIDYERMKGMTLVKDHDLDNFKLTVGTCKLAHQKYWCACKGDWCNREPPPCSWMRNANPEDKNPKGCVEDGVDAKGSCVYCVAYHSKHEFNITTKDLKNGCQDPRINVQKYRRNSPYCMWMVRRTDAVVKGYEWRKTGWVTWKGDKLLAKDPEPGTCIMEEHSYICACKGDLCNKALPPCSWIRKVNSEDANPKGCSEDDESKALMPGAGVGKLKNKAMAKGEGRYNWEGNCVECSIMDVDFYNLTAEQLKDGCQDPRVQHFEKSNNSEYCTWRLIHTDGKYGKPGIISVKGDHLNHMDPPPESCVKHAHHYTCACIGEYCNKGLPPCTWIRKCDPENTNPAGCRNPDTSGNKWIGNCVECSLMDVDHYDLTVEELDGGCMDPRVQHFSKTNKAEYCTWRVIHTLGKSGTPPGIVMLKADHLNHMDPKPGTCVKHANHYTCACTGEYCNRGLPPCAWIRKCDPDSTKPTGCIEDFTGCVSCDLLESEKRYKIAMDKTKNGCMDSRIQDKNSIQMAEYCMWTITSTPLTKYKWPEGHPIRAGTMLLPQSNPQPGTCTASDGNFYCSCKGHMCNMVLPRCSMLRKAMSSKTSPMGCFEDQRKGKGKNRCSKCLYHPHAWSSKKDVKNGCADPRIQDFTSIDDAEYCIWVIDIQHFPGLIIIKDRNLDPDLKLEPEKCQVINNRYYCACKGNMCNKMEPKCSWLRKANDKDKNPKGCVEDESKSEVKEDELPKGMVGRPKPSPVAPGQGNYDWEGNCVECSLMDVDHYNLTPEDLVGGCQDPRVQHFEKTNNSEYCTWRIIHTDGKFGKPGLVSVKADSLNHMDPKPESCVKHKSHYTCACIGEYCNKDLPPCSWIRKCDPENKNPQGCLGANKPEEPEDKECAWSNNCVECSLLDVDDYNLAPEELEGGCQDPRVQKFAKNNQSEYCTWRIVHTLGKTGTPPGAVAVKADKLNHMDPPPGSCARHKQHYTCSCIGDYCNKDLPPCSWIRKADPDNTDPIGCAEDEIGARKAKTKRCKEGNPGIDCAYCSLDDLRRNDSSTADNACNDIANMDFETQKGTKYEFTHCGWTIQGKDIEGYKRGAIFAKRGAFAQELDDDCPGTCTYNDENKERYYCACGQDRCNTKLPPCSWLRAANPADTNPLGCIEDGVKATDGVIDSATVSSSSSSTCFGSKKKEDEKSPEASGTSAQTSVLAEANSASKSTTTSKPTTAKPTTAKPTTAKPTTAKPTTSKPTQKPTPSSSSPAGSCQKPKDDGPGIDCAYCSYDDLKRNDSGITKHACNSASNMDFKTQHGTKYVFTHCGWTIQGKDIEGYPRGVIYAKRGAFAQEFDEDRPERCTYNDENLGRYYCTCCTDKCNTGLPACSWLRAANPSDREPSGCTENYGDNQLSGGNQEFSMVMTTVALKAPKKGFECVDCEFVPSQPPPYPDLNNGCEDTRIHDYASIPDSDYCVWKIGYEQDDDMSKGKILMLDGDRLEGHVAGQCKLETGNYYCACKGYMCNKERPPCSWLRKANPEDKNPQGCFEDQFKGGKRAKIQTEYEGHDKKLIEGNERVTAVGVKKGEGRFDWEGNCVECSLMDVDFYNLTTEDVPDGCQDPRIQYFEKSNNSEYCTWRIIHTEGKFGKVGLVSVKADQLNHMDPPPETCVKHKNHYTCACIGEYCNKELPPCSWILRADPENKNPLGCLAAAPKGGEDWIGNCIECSLMDVDFYGLTSDDLKGGCMDPRVQHYEKTNNSPYCTWRIVHTKGKSGDPGLVVLKADRLNHMDPKPSSCAKHRSHYTCACTGEYCNKLLPPCAWITAIDPDNKDFPGCLENGPKGVPEAVLPTEFDDENLITQIKLLVARIKLVLLAQKNSRKCIKTDSAKIAAIIKSISS